jgi:RNA polymerase primary sigma factor
MYLREMGSVELLSREGEIAIAKRIEAGREAMIAGLCESPLTFQAIIIWRDELNEGKVLCATSSIWKRPIPVRKAKACTAAEPEKIDRKTARRPRKRKRPAGRKARQSDDAPMSSGESQTGEEDDEDDDETTTSRSPPWKRS